MMKYIIPFLSMFLFSCNKDAIVKDPNVLDSMMVEAPVNNSIDSVSGKDSRIINAQPAEKNEAAGVKRQVEENAIIRTADASMLPFTIDDQFTTDSQNFILKVSNVSNAKLKISVDTKTPMNIRINQIIKPDGTSDGPFGKTLKLDTPQKGEYSIIIGKNLMADGSGVGRFSLTVE